MIRGLGIDVVQVSRIEEAVRRHGERFLHRLLTEAEIAYCAGHRDPGRHWAARFAAKEAVMKALGTGWGAGVNWKSIEITNLPSGQPVARLTGGALERARALGASGAWVTISHDGGLAVVAAVLVDGDGEPGGAPDVP